MSMKKFFIYVVFLFFSLNVFSQTKSLSKDELKDLYVYGKIFGKYLDFKENNTFVSNFTNSDGDEYNITGEYKFWGDFLVFSNVKNSNGKPVKYIYADEHGIINFDESYMFFPDQHNDEFIGGLISVEAYGHGYDSDDFFWSIQRYNNIKSIYATSTLIDKSKTDSYYSVSNIFDKSMATWIEGSADDGIGESITINFNKPLEQLYPLYIKNGHGDLKYYYENNRVKNISITFNNNFTVKAVLEDTYEVQGINLTKAKSYTNPIYSITFTIDSVYKGTKNSNTCIAEIFLPGDTSRFSFKTDLYRNELTFAYYKDIKKALDVKIGENGFPVWLKEWDEFDASFEGPDGDPYWITWPAEYPKNIFIVSYGDPFLIYPDDYTSLHDRDLARKIDIYTYKNNKWVLDNENPLYKEIRKIIESNIKLGKPMRFDFILYNDKEFFYISDTNGTSYYFDWKKSLTALPDVE